MFRQTVIFLIDISHQVLFLGDRLARVEFFLLNASCELITQQKAPLRNHINERYILTNILKLKFRLCKENVETTDNQYVHFVQY